jgi:phospholipid/cholesterol/gamma-HCH transport system substrate-binding protein
MERDPRVIWKVGLFVALGLLVSIVLVFAIRDWWVLRAGYEINVLFESASGIVVGAPVKFAGVEVGEVKHIRIVRSGTSPSSTLVEISLRLPEGFEIRSDDRALIAMLGLLGEKYVEILPGPGEGRVLNPGETLIGVGTISELELAQQLTHLLLRLEETLDAADALLGDPKVRERLNSTLERAERLTRQLDQTIRQAEGLMHEWQAVGKKSASLIDDMRRWAPLALAVALLLLLIR